VRRDEGAPVSASTARLVASTAFILENKWQLGSRVGSNRGYSCAADQQTAFKVGHYRRTSQSILKLPPRSLVKSEVRYGGVCSATSYFLRFDM
jgi:hypothetical protein